VGIGVHSDLGFFRDGRSYRVAGMVLPRAAKFTACRGIVGCAPPGAAFAAYEVAETAGFGFPAWVEGCGKPALIGRGAFFTGVKRTWFPLEKGEWCVRDGRAMRSCNDLRGGAARKAIAYTENFRGRGGAFAVASLPRALSAAAGPLTHWTAVITTP